MKNFVSFKYVAPYKWLAFSLKWAASSCPVDEGSYLRQSSLYKQILQRTPSRPILCALYG
jgi:hypothetical protein